VNAQEYSWLYGLAGTNTSFLNTDDIISKTKPGYQMGIGFYSESTAKLNHTFELISIKTPVELLNENSDYDLYNFTDFRMSYYLNYSFVDVEEDVLFYGFFSGAYFDLSAIRNKEGTYSPITYSPSGVNQIQLNEVEKFNYGVSFGLFAGYKKFGARIVYNLGLSNYFRNIAVQTEPGSISTESLKGAKLSSLALNLSYIIF
jgi:hypothetical protein